MRKIVSLILVLFIALLSVSALAEGGTKLTSGGTATALEGYDLFDFDSWDEEDGEN